MNLRPALNSNLTISMIEGALSKLDIKLSDNHKLFLSILIPGLIYRDGSIIIMSATINQLNKLLKRKREDINFVNILLAFDIVSDIDKYGVVTIPLSILLNKLTINKETISINGTRILRKKILSNTVQTMILSDLVHHIGIPKALAIPIISVILDLLDSDLDEEFKYMSQTCTAFIGNKHSATKSILRTMEWECILLNAMILSVINYIGLNIGSSLILVTIVSDIASRVKCEYKMKHAKGFLK